MSQPGITSFAPTDALTYDPEDPRYFDRRKIDEEVQRAFAICNACRMCFKYCDSFPTLFDLIDRQHEGDVTKLTAPEVERVMGQCFQCKLCEVQCPYTPRDNHEWQLDFPKLVHRYTAARGKEQGFTLTQRVLGNPDATAKLARASLGLANAMNKVRPARVMMEKTAGIHRDKLLPEFAPQTFEKWAKSNGKIAEEPGCEAVLFQTCFVQNNDPGLGRDALEVLEKNGVDVRCVSGLQCCGMPAWEYGDLESLRRQARVNLDRLLPFVERGAKVLVVNPTCSMMMRREWPHLLEGSDRPRAEKLAAAVMDPSEFLWSIRNEPRFNTQFLSTPGPTLAYHAPCHLRAQGVGFKGRDLLRKIPGVERITTAMECCGHNGTYAMRIDGFEPSARIGKRAFDGMKEAEAQVWATDCPLAAVQFQQHAGVKPMHPLTILARAYRADGFPTPVPQPKEESDETRAAR